MEYYDDDGYGAGSEGIFEVNDNPCPRCGSLYRRDVLSIFKGKQYMACANCGLYLEDLGTHEVFSKPYKMYNSSGLHERGRDLSQYW